jgi:hypothetical protein
MAITVICWLKWRLPEGLESRLTVTDLRDLLAFLEATGRK